MIDDPEFRKMIMVIPGLEGDQIHEMKAVVDFWAEKKSNRPNLTREEIDVYNLILAKLRDRKRLGNNLIESWSPYGAKIRGYDPVKMKQACGSLFRFIDENLGRVERIQRLRAINLILECVFSYLKNLGYLEDHRSRLYDVKSIIRQTRKLVEDDSSGHTQSECLEIFMDMMDDIEDVIGDASKKKSINMGLERIMSCLLNLEAVIDFCYPGYRKAGVLPMVLRGEIDLGDVGADHKRTDHGKIEHRLHSEAEETGD